MFTKAVIFDFDGTLADTIPGIVLAMQSALRIAGLPVADGDAIRKAIGLPLSETLKVSGVPEDMGEYVGRIYREQFDLKAIGLISVFEGVTEILSQLRRDGLLLSIASSRHMNSLGKILDAKDLWKYFDAVAPANGDYRPKPAPDMALHLISRMNVKASGTLVVGDTTFDLEMGRSAGCRTCGVTYGNHGREKLLSASPDFIIDDFRELPSVIERLNTVGSE